LIGLLRRNFNTPPPGWWFLNLYRLGWFDGFGWLRGLRLPDRFVLPKSFRLPFGEFALRLSNIEDVGNIAPPNFGELVSCAITGHVQRQSPMAGMGDVLAKLDFVRCENLHAFSLRVQGAAVTTKTPKENQTTVESKNYEYDHLIRRGESPLDRSLQELHSARPEKYRALNELKDSIIGLRERKASYETIRAMLHENAGIEVSHQTVARYCREMLDLAKPKKPPRSKTPAAEAPASAPVELPARPTINQPRPRSPRIYDPKSL
jgi:hypothetical protein